MPPVDAVIDGPEPKESRPPAAQEMQSAIRAAAQASCALLELTTLKAARERFEREYIGAILQHHGGNVAAAARTLGIERTNLYRKARQLGIAIARQGQRI